MKVAIVGAGVSGLSAAYFLLERDPSLEIELFEQNATIGGRMATLEVANSSVDAGCQYLSVDHEDILSFINKTSNFNGLKTLPQPLLCLPDGWIVEADKRFYFAEGMQKWLTQLLENTRKLAPLKLHTGHKLERLESLDAFDRVLVSVPGPEARKLGATSSVEYMPCLSLIFNWHKAPFEALEHYAYRDLSQREGVTWLAHEGLKRDQAELWLAQVSPEASTEWAKLLPHNEEGLEDILKEDLRHWIPEFAQGEKTLISAKLWPHAFPVSFLDPSEQVGFERHDKGPLKRVYYFGDGYFGVGRVENAIQSAMAVVEDFFRNDLRTQGS